MTPETTTAGFSGTTEDLLWSTVDYYFPDPDRCGYDAEAVACKYLTRDNKRCAIGRFLPDNVATDSQALLGDALRFDPYFPNVPGLWRRAIQQVHDRLAEFGESSAIAHLEAAATSLYCDGEASAAYDLADDIHPGRLT